MRNKVTEIRFVRLSGSLKGTICLTWPGFTLSVVAHSRLKDKGWAVGILKQNGTMFWKLERPEQWGIQVETSNLCIPGLVRIPNHSALLDYVCFWLDPEAALSGVQKHCVHRFSELSFLVHHVGNSVHVHRVCAVSRQLTPPSLSSLHFITLSHDLSLLWATVCYCMKWV